MVWGDLPSRNAEALEAKGADADVEILPSTLVLAAVGAEKGFCGAVVFCKELFVTWIKEDCANGPVVLNTDGCPNKPIFGCVVDSLIDSP